MLGERKSLRGKPIASDSVLSFFLTFMGWFGLFPSYRKERSKHVTYDLGTHLVAVKRILRYVAGTLHHGLFTILLLHLISPLLHIRMRIGGEIL